MGKSSSKLSAESLERLRYHHHQHRQHEHHSSGESQGGSGITRISPSSLRNPKTSSKAQGESKEMQVKNLRKGLSLDQLPLDAQLNNILDDDVSLVNFLTDIFSQEVEISDSMQTLFRGNCMASKIMSHCFRTFGSKYLKQLLEPHIKPLIQLTNDVSHNDNEQQLISNHRNTDDISYEIDSTRLEEDGNINQNQKNLLRLTRQILDSILLSANDFPAQLNLMCVCLRQLLCEKYPNSSTYLKAIGTVIFLRFINPAIVAPYEAGIVDHQPPPRTMRGLMLVSKILQNIANNVEFSKEEHMLPFNDFVRTQFEPMRQWVSEISSERPGSEVVVITLNNLGKRHKRQLKPKTPESSETQQEAAVTTTSTKERDEQFERPPDNSD